MMFPTQKKFQLKRARTFHQSIYVEQTSECVLVHHLIAVAPLQQDA